MPGLSKVPFVSPLNTPGAPNRQAGVPGGRVAPGPTVAAAPPPSAAGAAPGAAPQGPLFSTTSQGPDQSMLLREQILRMLTGGGF